MDRREEKGETSSISPTATSQPRRAAKPAEFLSSTLCGKLQPESPLEGTLGHGTGSFTLARRSPKEPVENAGPYILFYCVCGITWTTVF